MGIGWRSVALALAFALGLAPEAKATLQDGTPITVAPGVPAHGRHWELVTSEEPNSATPFFAYAIGADRLAYSTIGQLPGVQSGAFPAPALSIRGAAGWPNEPLLPPYPGLEGLLEPGPVAFDPSFERSIWGSWTPSEEKALFRRGPDGSFTLLGTEAQFVGASTDLSRIVFESSNHFVSADAGRTSGSSLYEAEGEAVRLVDAGETGEELSSCGAKGGEPDGVSDDGRRIFFTARPGCAGTQRVYMRSDHASTTEISASQCSLADCGSAATVSFVGATPSGSAAFLVTTQRLTDDDTDSSADLYRYDVADGKLSLLSGNSAEIVPSERAIWTSRDGSRVYFSATEHPAGGGTATRLFLADEDGLHVVPGLSMASRPFVQVTPNGRYAVFVTSAQLVPEDTDASADAYRYDAETGDVVLVSMGEGGRGNGAFDIGMELILPEFTINYRTVSDDGSRIFFNTEEQLVPEDANEVSDVYEWDNGDLGLISPGSTSTPSSFVGASSDGTSAYFETGDTLLPRDRDGSATDIYAARLGDAIPEPSPALPGCVGVSCSPGGSRAERPHPATDRPAPRQLRLARLGARARHRAARSGLLTLLAEVPQTGRLRAMARARIARKSRVVAEKTVEVRRAGSVRLQMRLSKAARLALRRGVRLRLRLRAHLSGLPATTRSVIKLRAVR